MKAAVAAMIMAGSVLKGLGIQLKGDYKVAAVSLEELGGAGTIATIEKSSFLGDLVVIGEATNMQLALGHRSSTKVQVIVEGRSCHASAPERGVNALYKAVELIQNIREKLIPQLPGHRLYGKVTIAITRISVKPDAFNVVPEECIFYIDCRYHPEFVRSTLIEKLEAIIEEMKREDPDFSAYIPEKDANSSFSGYYTNPEEYPIVDEVQSALAEALGVEPKVGTWRFATDGGKYYRKGLPVVGFGPSEEKYAHTHQDNVRVEDYLTAIKVYAWLACKICGVDYSG
jgi:acetylornithine deacetylase/succinyl-diaminopimelate desuccinylase-like protein